MRRIDWFITRRLALHMGGAILVFYGLIAMSEALDIWRFQWLSETRGVLVAIAAIAAAAARWSIKVLPVTLLIGAILAILDLRRHREIVAVNAAGTSIWQIVRGPVIFTFVAGLCVSLIVDDVVTRANRAIMPAALADGIVPGPDADFWLEQSAGDYDYRVRAARIGDTDRTLQDVTFFLPSGRSPSRISAETARLSGGKWLLRNAVLSSATGSPERFETYELPSRSSPSDLELRLVSTEDFTFFELTSALAAGIRDPANRAAVQTRSARLAALPALLVGSLLIAFAFTAGYRRSGSYGSTITYGIMLGFVVFVITEMADRAGSAGVLDPTFAAWGPAIVAIVIGLTVLLYKEDGRA